MVAGLVVALAVVTLSKNVANQFYEEVRANSAETSARLASQRLRADISRAGLMSTGNIVSDIDTAHAPGGNGAKGDAELQQLSGVRVYTGGSITPAPLNGLVNAPAGPTELATQSAAQTPALTPDSLAVYGNLTSGDEYFGSIDPTVANPCGGGKTIRLNPDDPSLLRIIREPNGTPVPNADAQAALSMVFAPIAGARFFARVTDTKGKYHYATTCDTPVTIIAPNVYVHLRLPNSTMTSTETLAGHGGVDGFETISVSPIQGAYWFVGKLGGAHATAGAFVENAGNAALSTSKFDLYRAWISADSTKGVLAANAEVVAEFAVDLKLGFTVDDPAQPETSASKARVFGFNASATDRNDWANRDLTTAAAPIANRGSIGPQRIRSMRYRLTTRAAQPDRDQPLAPPAGSDFIYRYRFGTSNRYARARVTQGEVALVNQARMNY